MFGSKSNSINFLLDFKPVYARSQDKQCGNIKYQRGLV